MEISPKKWYPPHLVASLGLLMVTLMVKRRQLGIRVSIELRNVNVKNQRCRRCRPSGIQYLVMY